MAVPCYWLEPTGRVRVGLRRYVMSETSKCPGPGGYHNAGPVAILEDAPLADWCEVLPADGDRPAGYHRVRSELVSREDPRWPAKCEGCDYLFAAGDGWQVWADELHSGALDGRLYTIRDAPAGALWDAWWLRGAYWEGADGIALMCRTPGGDWHVDGRASNCTLPEDHVHKCWCRHGDPRVPATLTVDKVGVTCSAGAGSIVSGSYHGFLQSGYLT